MKTLISFFLALCASFHLYAADFIADNISYTITSTSSPYTVAVCAGTDKYKGSVTIPASVIYDNIEYSVTAIGDDAFADCTGLTAIYFPATIQSIGNYSFYQCIGLTTLDFPSSLLSIGNCAFYNCFGITSVSLPKLTSLGDHAFFYCTVLSNINLPSSLTSIGNYVFRASGTSVNVEKSNPNYSSIDGVLFNKEQTELIYCPMSKKDNYSIPSSVTSLYKGAFKHCLNLTSIVIPASVTNIGDDAFSNCSNLAICSIPTSVTVLGDYVFQNCSTLTSIQLPAFLSSIGDFTFMSCTNLTSIYVYASTPLDISNSSNVFFNVNKTNCTLYVPKGSKTLYQAAEQWKDFENIVEFDANSVDMPTTHSNIELYPNPTTSDFFIKALKNDFVVDVYDLNGKLIFSKRVQNNTKIETKSLAKGAYIVKVNGESKKLIITN